MADTWGASLGGYGEVLDSQLPDSGGDTQLASREVVSAITPTSTAPGGPSAPSGLMHAPERATSAPAHAGFGGLFSFPAGGVAVPSVTHARAVGASPAVTPGSADDAPQDSVAFGGSSAWGGFGTNSSDGVDDAAAALAGVRLYETASAGSAGTSSLAEGIPRSDTRSASAVVGGNDPIVPAPRREVSAALFSDDPQQSQQLELLSWGAPASDRPQSAEAGLEGSLSAPPVRPQSADTSATFGHHAVSPRSTSRDSAQAPSRSGSAVLPATSTPLVDDAAVKVATDYSSNTSVSSGLGLGGPASAASWGDSGLGGQGVAYGAAPSMGAYAAPGLSMAHGPSAISAASSYTGPMAGSGGMAGMGGAVPGVSAAHTGDASGAPMSYGVTPVALGPSGSGGTVMGLVDLSTGKVVGSMPLVAGPGGQPMLVSGMPSVSGYSGGVGMGGGMGMGMGMGMGPGGYASVPEAPAATPLGVMPVMMQGGTHAQAPSHGFHSGMSTGAAQWGGYVPPPGNGSAARPGHGAPPAAPRERWGRSSRNDRNGRGGRGRGGGYNGGRGGGRGGRAQQFGAHGLAPGGAPMASPHGSEHYGSGRPGSATDEDASPWSNAVPADVSVEDVRGHVVDMFRDQAGCRLLQGKLDSGDVAVRDTVFTETLPHITSMMTDAFGNYLFQKLVEHATRQQRREIVMAATADATGALDGAATAAHAGDAPKRPAAGGSGGSLARAAFNLHGTRSVQKLLEVCRDDSDEVVALTSALRPVVVPLSMDPNGNHVIQVCLKVLAPAQASFVLDAIAADLAVVARHRHGCCVVQRCMDAADDAVWERIVDAVLTDVLSLMQDPFGNYVVQYVLQRGSPRQVAAVAGALRGNLPRLSAQKFSSNVVEKCLDASTEPLRTALVDELSEGDVAAFLLGDQYGNYVVQKALSVASDAAGLRLVGALRPHLASLGNSSSGRRIAARILRRFPGLALPGVAGADR